MPRNNEGSNMAASFLPRTFPSADYPGFKVTINADRSITVKPGDWLSKYAIAIWGDFTYKHLLPFWRKKDTENGPLWQRVIDVNKDLLTTGETLYYMDWLPDEPHIGRNPSSIIGLPGDLPPGAEPKRNRRDEFLQYICDSFVPTDWSVNDGGCDLNVSFVTAGYSTLSVERPGTPIRWFHAASLGVVLGSDDAEAGVSFSLVRIPGCNFGFPGTGWVFTPGLVRNALFHYDNFRGGIITVSLGFNYWIGASLTALVFGMGFPPSRVYNSMQYFFRTGDRLALVRLFESAPCSGVMILVNGDVTVPGPGFNVAARLGYMTDLPAAWRSPPAWQTPPSLAPYLPPDH